MLKISKEAAPVLLLVSEDKPFNAPGLLTLFSHSLRVEVSDPGSITCL